MSFQHLQYELSNQVGLLVIHRPRALNALNSQVLNELETFAHSMVRTKDCRVLIITGAGDKSFVAGADIKEMVNFNSRQAIAFAKKGQQVFSMIEALPFPVIAAINGFALGGGLELALTCDIIIMSEKAKVGLPEVTLGLLPAFGGTQRLTRAVGMYKAKEMICSGNVYPAREALTYGLGNKVTPHPELMSTARALANDIKQVSPLATAKAKKLIHSADNRTLSARLQKEVRQFGALFNHPDAKEGMRAFLEKRKPQFKGGPG